MISKTSPVPIISEEDKDDIDYTNFFNKSIKGFFKTALRIIPLRIALKDPSKVYFLLQTIRRQKKAAQVRRNWEKQGVHVPPSMIISITNRCNLRCKGCFVQALNRSSDREMSEDKVRSVLAEAKELGIPIVVIVGGEPLVRKELLNITKDFPEIIFPVFTNGLLLNEEMITKLKKQKNVVLVFSLEGHGKNTDERRGKGVFERLQNIMGQANSKDIFFGVSLTITRSNFAAITDEQFIRNLVDSGCKLFFLVEYVPMEGGPEDWTLTNEQRATVLKLKDSFSSRFPAIFFAFPGDEDRLGGCISAGRGFVHITAEGDLEACPLAPFSDTNLRDLSLKDALQSEFLKTIRQNREQLIEGEGACALWEKREWVQSLLYTK